MKCANCGRSVESKDHQDVLFALGQQTKRVYERIEKFLGLNSRNREHGEVDDSGNAVTCGTCYADTLNKALRGD